MRLAFALGLLVPAAGCGRVGFDGADASVDSPDGDTSSGTAPIHRYRLENSYADDMGGPALAPLGGTFAAGGYRFGVNQGLAVANAMPIDVYTIDMTLSLDVLSDWRKIIDFKGLTTDDGGYLENAKFAFVEQATMQNFVESTTTLVAAVPVEVTLTRDASGLMVGYVAKAKQFKITDALGAGTFSAQFATANFAIDDHATNQSEAGTGVIREIRIWNTALSEAQVAAL